MQTKKSFYWQVNVYAEVGKLPDTSCYWSQAAVETAEQETCVSAVMTQWQHPCWQILRSLYQPALSVKTSSHDSCHPFRADSTHSTPVQAACHWVAPFPPLSFINRARRVRFMILLSCLALLWTLVWLQVNTVNIRTVVMVLGGGSCSDPTVVIQR